MTRWFRAPAGLLWQSQTWRLEGCLVAAGSQCHLEVAVRCWWKDSAGVPGLAGAGYGL